jgi:hypothetical protein
MKQCIDVTDVRGGRRSMSAGVAVCLGRARAGSEKDRKEATGAACTLHVRFGARSAERNLVHLECPQTFLGAGVLFLIDAQACSGVR